MLGQRNIFGKTKLEMTISLSALFGKYGRVYDTGSASTPSWLLDTAVEW